MRSLPYLVKRNIKIFFKDKGMFFTSLITPGILLILYVTFLGNIYEQSFRSNLPNGVPVSDELIKGAVGGQLVASLLAVCCVTVAFCCNMLMVQDKVTGASDDFAVTPVKKSTMALAYYVATFISTAVVCLASALLCFAYLAFAGWYLSVGDVALILLDVILLVMFGTAISSVVNMFLTTQGQISAVGTIVSAGYGFICGAYMPISQFGDTLQRVVSFLPGTYGTTLIKSHAMRGVFADMEKLGFPVEIMKRDLDCTISFFANDVTEGAMFAVVSVSIIVLVGIYVLFNTLIMNKKK